MKHKSQKSKETPNLKRFRFMVDDFNTSHQDEWSAMQIPGEKRILTITKGKTRKEKRKEERKLKKMRKDAYSRRQPIPTKESLAKEKKEAREKERKVKAKEKKKEEKKKTKEKIKDQKKQAEETRVQGLVEANKLEDQAIKQLEKQLGLNKRKSKNLPLGFKNDGLDYLLEAVNSESLQTMYDAGKMDSSDEDAPKSSWDIEDEEASSDESGDDLPSDNDDDDISNDEEEDSVKQVFSKAHMKALSESSSILKQSKTAKTDKRSRTKAVHFQDSEKQAEEERELEGDSESDFEEFDEFGSDMSHDDMEFQDSDSDLGQSQSKKSKGKLTKNVNTKKSSIKHLVQEESSSEEFSDSNSSDENVNEPEPGVKEDIYGRLRDDEGNIMEKLSGAYIPPAKRKQVADTADVKRQLELERMKKQLKGLLNRLSESNMQPISGQVQDMYRTHSRMDVTEILTTLIMEACISSIRIPERLIMEHAMLVAILHGNVGSEIGAYILQTCAKQLNSLLSHEEYGTTKETDNLLVLIANLYNFKVVQSLLIFDILKKLAETFREKDIELLLVLLKNVGFSLRKDNAVALKEMILLIQDQATRVDTSSFEDPSRVRFMLDVLLAIKNNNMRKIPNYDPSHLDHLRKLIRTYVKGSSVSDNHLRISFTDLLNADSRGRWWLVGSAWSGRQDEGTSHGEPSVVADAEASGSLLELARQQRMNTEVRKNIFCAIMSSEDFVDAFEKLLRLGLKHQHEREIIIIIIDLCTQEKDVNPFYSFLAQKFCEYDRRFQMTVQFTLWDKFKELHEFKDHKLSNLAAFLTHLIASKAMSLSVFKVIEFGELDKPRVQFMKKVLNSLLTDQPEQVIHEVFNRIATLPKLHMLREGLKLFLRHFLLRGSKHLDSESRNLLEERIKIAERSLISLDTRMLL